MKKFLCVLVVWSSCFWVEGSWGKRFCGDEACTSLIAEGKTLQPSSVLPETKGLLSFVKGAHVMVYGRGDETEGYLDVEIEGKRGYVPKEVVTITKDHVIDLVSIPLGGEYNSRMGAFSRGLYTALEDSEFDRLKTNTPIDSESSINTFPEQAPHENSSFPKESDVQAPLTQPLDASLLHNQTEEESPSPAISSNPSQPLPSSSAEPPPHKPTSTAQHPSTESIPKAPPPVMPPLYVGGQPPVLVTGNEGSLNTQNAASPDGVVPQPKAQAEYQGPSHSITEKLSSSSSIKETDKNIEGDPSNNSGDGVEKKTTVISGEEPLNSAITDLPPGSSSDAQVSRNVSPSESALPSDVPSATNSASPSEENHLEAQKPIISQSSIPQSSSEPNSTKINIEEPSYNSSINNDTPISSTEEASVQPNDPRNQKLVETNSVEMPTTDQGSAETKSTKSSSTINESAGDDSIKSAPVSQDSTPESLNVNSQVNPPNLASANPELSKEESHDEAQKRGSSQDESSSPPLQQPSENLNGASPSDSSVDYNSSLKTDSQPSVEASVSVGGESDSPLNPSETDNTPPEILKSTETISIEPDISNDSALEGVDKEDQVKEVNGEQDEDYDDIEDDIKENDIEKKKEIVKETKESYKKHVPSHSSFLYSDKFNIQSQENKEGQHVDSPVKEDSVHEGLSVTKRMLTSDDGVCVRLLYYFPQLEDNGKISSKLAVCAIRISENGILLENGETEHSLIDEEKNGSLNQNVVDLPNSNSHDESHSEQLHEEKSAEESSNWSASYFDHYIKDLYPSWFYAVIHDHSFSDVSSEFSVCMIISAISLCTVYFIRFLMEKSSKEGPLKAKVALLDKQLFEARNDHLLIKKKLDGNGLANSMAKTVIKQETPAQVLQELEQLKEEREKLLNDSYQYQIILQEKAHIESEKDNLQSLYDQSQLELTEAENIVLECLEEKKQAKSIAVDQEELRKIIDTLRERLESQKQAVLKYENKLKKRDVELKEKIQDLRKQRADAANAKLLSDKLTTVKKGLEKRIEALEGIDRERELELERMREKGKEFETMKTKISELNDDVEKKELEIEAKSTEIEVMNHTVEALKQLSASDETDGNGNGGDGWDFQESSPNFEKIEELSRLRVDLKKASEACENLSGQLIKVETERDSLLKTLEEQNEEVDVSRKIKDQATKEKLELEHKHEVLTTYFNQREAELQKQLGLQTARLGDAEQNTESSSKQMTSLCEELESYKSQLKTLKLEMEEMERSWKSQNASLEKKQHESWVTVRQEARRNAEAQTEMQTLRSRLTVTEAKLLERETEIKCLSDENKALKESIKNITTSQPMNNLIKPEPIYPNGHGLSGLGNSSGRSSGPSSIGSVEAPPPELPPLPFFPPPPIMPMMPMMSHNQSIMDTHRPAPVGRRSPTRGGNGGRYSRSPSPGYYNNRSGMYRDSSPGSRSDRSRFDYSPSPPYRRHSSREHSPDRFSTRSDRSDLSRHRASRHRSDTSYRDTPSRDFHRRPSNEFPGSGHDEEGVEDESAFSKRNNNHSRMNNNKSSRKHGGPKTSSPMVDRRDFNI